MNDRTAKTVERARMQAFHDELLAARSTTVSWKLDKHGEYTTDYARDAWAAWQEARRGAHETSDALGADTAAGVRLIALLDALRAPIPTLWLNQSIEAIHALGAAIAKQAAAVKEPPATGTTCGCEWSEDGHVQMMCAAHWHYAYQTFKAEKHPPGLADGTAAPRVDRGCQATVPERWYAAAHPCPFPAISGIDGRWLCGVHARTAEKS